MVDLQSVWDYDDPAASEARFRELLPVDDVALAIEIESQIARAQGLQRAFDDAQATLDAAEARLGDGMPRARVRVLLERGRVLNSSGEREAARPCFTEAWEAACDAGLDGLAVDAAHMLAIVAPSDEALAWNERALELASTSQDPDATRWEGSLRNNIGWTHHGEGRFDAALAQFESALAFREASGTGKEVRVARWCVARCMRSLGRVEEALGIQRDLESGVEDGYVQEELAECLHALGRTDESRRHFAKAHALLGADAWFAEAEADRLARLKELSS